MRRRKWGAGTYLVVSVISVAILMFPLYWTIISSLKTKMQLFSSHQTLIPTTPQWVVYWSVLNAQWSHLVTSLIVAVGTVIVSLLISAPAAFAMAFFRTKRVFVLLIILLIVQMIPGISLANALFVIFHKLGLLNSYLGLILADATYAIPFDVLILRAFMLSLPTELLEASFVDGTGEWGAFVRVILPITKPALVTVSLFSFIFAWGDFIFAITMTTSNSIEPVTVALYHYSSQYGVDWSSMMAFAVLASIPAAIFLIFAQRFIKAGISSAGLKG